MTKACPFISGVVVIPPTVHQGYMSTAATRSVIVPCLEEGCQAWQRQEGYCKLIDRKCH